MAADDLATQGDQVPSAMVMIDRTKYSSFSSKRADHSVAPIVFTLHGLFQLPGIGFMSTNTLTKYDTQHIIFGILSNSTSRYYGKHSNQHLLCQR